MSTIFIFQGIYQKKFKFVVTATKHVKEIYHIRKTWSSTLYAHSDYQRYLQE